MELSWFLLVIRSETQKLVDDHTIYDNKIYDLGFLGNIPSNSQLLRFSELTMVFMGFLGRTTSRNLTPLVQDFFRYGKFLEI